MGILEQRFKEALDRYNQLNMQQDMQSAKVQGELARGFRLSKSDIGNILAEMMEKDQVEKMSRRRIRLR